MESKDDVSKRQRMVQEEDIITYLRSLKSIRDRCYAIFHLGREGKLPNFRVHLDKLPGTERMFLFHRTCEPSRHITDAVNYVHNLMQKRFPGGFKDVPFHARWEDLSTILFFACVLRTFLSAGSATLKSVALIALRK